MTSTSILDTTFSDALEQHLQVITELASSFPLLKEVARKMYTSLCDGGKVLWFGNGGSAGDSQHLAAELVGRFRRERRGMASIALTTDSSLLTAIGNDYGFECIFSRQIEALCAPRDVVVGISTSGNSPNVCSALVKARELGAYSFAMTGASGGKVINLADACLRIQSTDTARIQEAHILAGHMLCAAIEDALCGDAARAAKGERW